MVVIIGGACHGKTTFIKSLVNNDLICNNLENISNNLVIDDFHQVIDTKPNLYKHLIDNPNLLKNKIIIGNDIGLGIVPIDESLRIKRDEIGRIYQHLIKQSDIVIRVWYGTITYLKGNKEQLLNFIEANK